MLLIFSLSGSVVNAYVSFVRKWHCFTVQEAVASCSSESMISTTHYSLHASLFQPAKMAVLMSKWLMSILSDNILFYTSVVFCVLLLSARSQLEFARPNSEYEVRERVEVSCLCVSPTNWRHSQ
uniref:Uncharacterized protein n=1 Tax=Strigamia maritima TaxID=126957 RepID=T1IJU0_STRMM